jgi:hypothetical protein
MVCSLPALRTTPIRSDQNPNGREALSIPATPDTWLVGGYYLGKELARVTGHIERHGLAILAALAGLGGTVWLGFTLRAWLGKHRA